MNEDTHATVPMNWVGPIRITGNTVTDEVSVPLATFESTIWPSTARGAKVSREVDKGIVATLTDDRMTRSILLEADDAGTADRATRQLTAELDKLRAVVTDTSRFAQLLEIHHEIAGNLLFLRFEFTTGDASGHNMTTLTSDRLMTYILDNVPGLRYGSISGNYCTDKKATAVNGILGRGKKVITELLVPAAAVAATLHTTTAKVVELNVRKNLIGTLLAGGIRSANAHYANLLLAFYLATGQDAANIVEGSQGVTHTEDRDGDLYFSCTLPNIIVGTTGNGKHHDFAQRNLHRLGCATEREPGSDAHRLAVLVAAAVLCGELSLMAAQTNPGELMKAHATYERSTRTPREE